jgi:hypothetical protein
MSRVPYLGRSPKPWRGLRNRKTGPASNPDDPRCEPRK